MKKRKIYRVGLFLCMTFFLLSGCGKKQTEMPDIVKDLGIGWNLGNALEMNEAIEADEITDYEQGWGNPEITEILIDKVAQAGFRTIRIPVTWENHMDENGNLEEAWLKRVETVVNYVLDAGCYAVINVHHDSWYELGSQDYDAAEKRMRKIWRQIGLYFQDYDEHLLFEGMNEPRMFDSVYEWSGGNEETSKKLNYLNEAFVETIRSLGGYNETRYLFVPTYSGSNLLEAIKELAIPNDAYIIVSIHAYTPYDFAMVDTGTSDWNRQNPWDTADVDMCMARIQHFFTEKGIPAVITECGAIDKGNNKAREEWLTYFLKKAKMAGVTCFWWDGGETENGKAYKLFDRNTGDITCPELVSILTSFEKL